MILSLKNTEEANYLFYKVNNLDINMDRFGVLITTYLDFKKSVFGFSEEINIENIEKEKQVNTDLEVVYDYNNFIQNLIMLLSLIIKTNLILILIQSKKL